MMYVKYLALGLARSRCQDTLFFVGDDRATCAWMCSHKLTAGVCGNCFLELALSLTSSSCPASSSVNAKCLKRPLSWNSQAWLIPLQGFLAGAHLHDLQTHPEVVPGCSSISSRKGICLQA